MRPILVLAAVLALALPALAAPVEEPPLWVVWSADGPDDPVALASGDIEGVRVASTPTHVHLALATYPATPELASAASRLDFTVQQGEGAIPVRFDWGLAPRLWVDGEEALTGWAVADGSGPLGWHLQVAWSTAGIDPALDFVFDGLLATTAVAFAPTGQPLPPRDTATGPALTFTAGLAGTPQASLPGLRAGLTVEGPDYAGGASITVDAAGQPLVAYYVYDDTRGTPRGIYLARVDGAMRGFDSERVGETAITRDGGRDAQMRTQVAYDGASPFVLFTDHPATDNDEDGPGDPGTPDSVVVLAKSGQGWRREDPTPGGSSDVGPEDVPDLVARDGRLVAAVPVGTEVWVVERDGDDAWRVLARLAGANNAKLALDSKGVVHVAFVVYATAEGSWRDGELYYATSRDGFVPVHVGDNIDSGWEEPETDGSFAIAVGPQDQVALLWNDGASSDRSREQRLALVDEGVWSHGYAPLSPSHGNPQYTMRLGFSQAGILVAASGYGGTDSLAALHGGQWTARPLDRYDVWDMVVAPAGTIFFAYTQPHGGTTLAVSAFAADDAASLGGEDEQTQSVDAEWFGPQDASALPAAVTLAVLLLAFAARRR